MKNTLDKFIELKEAQWSLEDLDKELRDTVRYFGNGVLFSYDKAEAAIVWALLRFKYRRELRANFEIYERSEDVAKFSAMFGGSIEDILLDYKSKKISINLAVHLLKELTKDVIRKDGKLEWKV